MKNANNNNNNNNDLIYIVLLKTLAYEVQQQTNSK